MVKISKILSFLFPEGIKCIFCEDDLQNKNDFCVCNNCIKKLPYINEKTCSCCGDKLVAAEDICINCKTKHPQFDKAISVFWYEDQICNLIYKFKYGNQKYLSKAISHFMLEKLKTFDLKIDLVLPVPLSIKKKKKRGFNQSELLAKNVSEKLKVNFCIENLVRVKDTISQSRLSKQERKENLKDAFKILDFKNIKGKNVLLVDDIFTTGSTAEECSRILKLAGAKMVYVLTFARTKIENSI